MLSDAIPRISSFIFEILASVCFWLLWIFFVARYSVTQTQKSRAAIFEIIFLTTFFLLVKNNRENKNTVWLWEKKLSKNHKIVVQILFIKKIYGAEITFFLDKWCRNYLCNKYSSL